MAKNNKQIVPQSKHVLNQWKYEIAAELGLPVGQGYNGFADSEFASELGGIATPAYRSESWGHLASRENGSVGGEITKRLIQKAEETLFTLS